MTLNDHEKSEWSRAAKGEVPIAQFDRAAEVYRLWLCFDEPKQVA